MPLPGRERGDPSTFKWKFLEFPLLMSMGGRGGTVSPLESAQEMPLC